MKNKTYKNPKSIKIRILKNTIALVSVILMGIFIAFNILLNDYINKNANSQLEIASEIIKSCKFNEKEDNSDDNKRGYYHRKKHSYSNQDLNHSQNKEEENLDSGELLKLDMGYLIEQIEKKSSAKYIITNSKGELLYPTIDEYYMYDINSLDKIQRDVKKNETKLQDKGFEQLSIEGDDYYSLILKLKKQYNKEDCYLVLFVDIKEQLDLAKNINILLLIIMLIAVILSIISTIFLSEKISKPIKKISEFATQIGNGDFTQSDMKFVDKELDELLSVMNKSASYLEEYDKSQKTFFQNISHELRTPLMSMMGYAEAIKYNIIDKEKASDIILEEGNKLKEMIEELLYISRIDNITKDYELSNCDVREILSSCIESKQASAMSKGIKLICDFEDKEVVYLCDEKSLRRAFLNIIENGLRYASSEIITSYRLKDNKIIVTIENDGPNIKEKDMPYIFDRFYKGENGKSGIGLAIVKSVIQNHEGNIYCENTKKGVKFTIELNILKFKRHPLK